MQLKIPNPIVRYDIPFGFIMPLNIVPIPAIKIFSKSGSDGYSGTG